MSYILDALRKSDQQRQQATAPTLLTARASVPDNLEQPRFSFFAWSGLNIALAVLLISAGVLIGWLQPWQQEDPMQRSAPAAASIAAPSAESAAAAINTPTTAQSVPAATMQPELAPSALIQPTRSQPALTQPALTPPIAYIPAPSATLPLSPSAAQVSPAQSSPTQTSPDPLITTAEKKVIPFSDLPAALRQSIPDISIAFHQYSTNPAERRAMINNEVLRAGDQIAPGLLLEQITSDGVILSYAGYTFKRGVR